MSLQEKLERISQESSEKIENFEKIKKEWQDKVNKVLNQIKEWLKPYTDSKHMDYSEREITITEEDLGTYKVKQLEYDIGNFKLIFEPIGRIIIGAWGRIDFYLRGNKIDKYILILLGDKFQDAKWYLSPFQDKSIRYEFNRQNLEKTLEYWIDKYNYSPYD